MGSRKTARRCTQYAWVWEASQYISMGTYMDACLMVFNVGVGLGAHVFVWLCPGLGLVWYEFVCRYIHIFLSWYFVWALWSTENLGWHIEVGTLYTLVSYCQGMLLSESALTNCTGCKNTFRGVCTYIYIYVHTLTPMDPLYSYSTCRGSLQGLGPMINSGWSIPKYYTTYHWSYQG